MDGQFKQYGPEALAAHDELMAEVTKRVSAMVNRRRRATEEKEYAEILLNLGLFFERHLHKDALRELLYDEGVELLEDRDIVKYPAIVPYIAQFAVMALMFDAFRRLDPPASPPEVAQN